jgi:hypothetical protein
MEYNPVTQVIIALIILLLMGYVAYNIYLIELHHMFKGNNDIRKETEIFNGIIDFKEVRELKYNTKNRAHENYRDISPSINQQGGAEYTYNFWLYVDQARIRQLKNDRQKDILLFLKGEKTVYFNNDYNYNCMYKSADDSSVKHPVLLTKNPLVRLSYDGKNLAVDYNNILSPDSYQNNSKYNRCDSVDNNKLWWDRNKNMIGVYDIEFSSKWFMVTIVMKEVADNNNILTKNRAICRIYINGLLIFENKLETIYGSNQDIYSATFKNNNSPLYINPVFDMKYGTTSNGVRKESGEATTIIERNLPYLDMNTVKLDNDKYQEIDNPNDISGIIKMGDLKYYNYALEADAINQLFRTGLKNVKLDVNKEAKYTNLNMLSSYELEKNEIKEL